jgi:hypothetical protein
LVVLNPKLAALGFNLNRWLQHLAGARWQVAGSLAERVAALESALAMPEVQSQLQNSSTN